jgi:uncharacterized protein YegP (UPF0339 family)
MSARFVLTRGGAHFFFTLQLESLELVLTSERHASRAQAVAGVEAVKEIALVDARYQRRTSLGHEPYFVLRGSHDEVLGTSAMFSSVEARNRAIAAVKAHAAVAVVFDET